MQALCLCYTSKVQLLLPEQWDGMVSKNHALQQGHQINAWWSTMLVGAVLSNKGQDTLSLVACLIKNLEKVYRAGCIYLGTLLVCLPVFPPSSVAIMDYWAWLTCICSFAFISLWGMTVNNKKRSVLSQTTLRLRRDFTAAAAA